ncbi:MAG TPA: peptidoglycan-binding domain-containing protein, partial [Candidatus Paceibacterota bacterium]|nr:peptidoglycan-binding domain-containing protein [Candidatus Paceibacterota bacterium]
MQTVAKIAAIVAGLGLIAMSFAAFTPQAGAQSPSIQAQINALLAQVERLQAQLNALQGGTSFTRDLTIGSSGADVTRLQQFLISRGHAIPAGATGYFGVQTRAAVAAYQSANAIAPTAGYFGPLTRTSVNAKLVVVPPPSNGDDDKDEDDDNDNLSGGEALLGGVRLEEGDDDEVEIGGNGEVAVLTFGVEDGDVRVNRLDLSFMAASGNGEDEPWNAFTEVTLYDADGHRIAREDVSDEDDWLENDDEPYVFRFTGLDYIVRENDEAELTVEVEVSNNAHDGDRWTISAEDGAIEAEDSTGD